MFIGFKYIDGLEMKKAVLPPLGQLADIDHAYPLA
jgi:hypothetical protein